MFEISFLIQPMFRHRFYAGLIRQIIQICMQCITPRLPTSHSTIFVIVSGWTAAYFSCFSFCIQPESVHLYVGTYTCNALTTWADTVAMAVANTRFYSSAAAVLRYITLESLYTHNNSLSSTIVTKFMALWKLLLIKCSMFWKAFVCFGRSSDIAPYIISFILWIAYITSIVCTCMDRLSFVWDNICYIPRLAASTNAIKVKWSSFIQSSIPPLSPDYRETSVRKFR